jgi:ComF family protein
MHATTWLRHELHGLFNFLLPPACALCQEPLDPPDPDTLCLTCCDSFPPQTEPHCPVCALPYPADTGPAHHCQNCLQHKKSFSGVTPLGPFEGPLREAVHRFKYRGDINLDRPLGNMLARKLGNTSPCFGMIVPVPLHPIKLRQRGYNQSTLIARQLARALKIPLVRDLLIRNKQGATQKEISARDRKKNVRQLFTCTRQLQGESILLVDDVMTTGATARESSKTLLRAGAKAVHVAVLARAPLK